MDIVTVLLLTAGLLWGAVHGVTLHVTPFVHLVRPPLVIVRHHVPKPIAWHEQEGRR